MESETDKAEGDCGCQKTETKSDRAARMRAARGKRKRTGEELFRKCVRNVAGECRDQFGRACPCPGEEPRTG